MKFNNFLTKRVLFQKLHLLLLLIAIDILESKCLQILANPHTLGTYMYHNVRTTEEKHTFSYFHILNFHFAGVIIFVSMKITIQMSALKQHSSSKTYNHSIDT